MQICIGLNGEVESNKMILLFFGEEYGFLTALYEAGRLQILYGKDDWLDHASVMNSNSSLLANITLNIDRYCKCMARKNLSKRHRHICVGATNSLGHNLINDVNGLLELTKYAILKGYDHTLISLGSGFFDEVAANNIASLTDISYTSLAQSGYAKHSYLDLPFYVRAYGYGFLDKERNILRGENNSLENARQAIKKEGVLYISIRSRHEDRHCEEFYCKTLKIVLAELRIKKVQTIVFDGMTKIENDQSLESNFLMPHINSQLLVASEFRSRIEGCFPGIKYINLINAKITEKIYYAMKSSVFVGPYGSGTWPILFMKRGTASILFQGEINGLKDDPTFDYACNNVNDRLDVVQVASNA